MVYQSMLRQIVCDLFFVWIYDIKMRRMDDSLIYINRK